MAWSYSPMYGHVALGPTQEAVYRFVLSRTEHGRRPTFTLAAIANATGKPVSSVHDALGRLRALGLIGCAARMGRTGGHRLWRVTRGSVGRLDIARHRRAVARLLKRWVLSVPTERDGVAHPSLWREPPEASAISGADDPPEVPSGDVGKVRDGGWGSQPPVSTSPGPTFRELIGLHHRLPWESDALEGSECARVSAEGVGL